MIAYSHQERAISFYLSAPLAPCPIDMLIIGAIHGDEPESAQITHHLLHACQPQSFAPYHFGLIPIANPDGFAAQQRGNAHYVDINRNFPTHDWAELHKGTRYYSGPAPLSEPESRFLHNVLQQYPPRKIISIHTYYRMVNMDGPAAKMAAIIASINGYPIHEDIGYPTPGSFGTYAGKELYIPTVTLELKEGKLNEAEIIKNIKGIMAAITHK